MENRRHIDHDAEGDQHDSRIDGEAGGVRASELIALKFAQKKSESGERETHAHEAEAGAYPGEKSAFGCKVRSWVIERVEEFVRHGAIVDVRTGLGLTSLLAAMF
jgi:hypothetical protein